jgi:hypothetical protein
VTRLNREKKGSDGVLRRFMNCGVEWKDMQTKTGAKQKAKCLGRRCAIDER